MISLIAILLILLVVILPIDILLIFPRPPTQTIPWNGRWVGVQASLEWSVGGPTRPDTDHSMEWSVGGGPGTDHSLEWSVGGGPRPPKPTIPWNGRWVGYPLVCVPPGAPTPWRAYPLVCLPRCA